YTDADIADFETRLTRIYMREVQGFRVCSLGGFRRRMSWREFILALGLHTTKEMQTAGFGLYWTESTRRIPDKGDLSALDRLIARSIVGRSQEPEKVTMMDLFYLRGMDVGSVNVPYLLARYLRLFSLGRKQGEMISVGQFVARLAKHFGLLTEERLQGLMVIMYSQDLLGRRVMQDELLRRLLWHQEVMRRMRRCLRLCHHRLGLRVRGLPDYRRRFTTWTVTSLAWLIDRVGVPYTRYSESPVEYQRRTRQRTDSASTSTTPQQPDP
ncbi:hypothetical protein Tco_0471316, partial [Tanacetum coccineum]